MSRDKCAVHIQESMIRLLANYWRPSRTKALMLTPEGESRSSLSELCALTPCVGATVLAFAGEQQRREVKLPVGSKETGASRKTVCWDREKCGQLPIKGKAARESVTPSSSLVRSPTQKGTRWQPGKDEWTMLVGWRSEGPS